MKKAEQPNNGKPERKTGSIVLFSAIMLAIAGPPASAQELHPEWSICQNDEQCTLIYVCGDMAVNKNYGDRFKLVACKKTTPHDPNSVAKCIHNICTIASQDQAK